MRFTAAQRPESESLHAFFLFLLPLPPAERLPPRGTLLFTSACCSVGAHAPYRCRLAAAPRVRQPDLTASRSFGSGSARIAIPPAQCRFAGLLDERRRACGSTPYRSRFQIAQHLRASSSTGKACASGLSRNIFVATLMIALMPACRISLGRKKARQFSEPILVEIDAFTQLQAVFPLSRLMPTAKI